jgi:uncharacterized membrane protein HdeD (DUF308 family)
MSHPTDPKPALSPELFWRVLLAGNAMSLGVLLLVFHRMMDAAVAPHIGYWLLAAGLLAVVPSILYRRHSEQRLRGAASSNARKMVQFNQVVIGCGLAELPGLLGCVYYLFSREWGGTLLLLAVSAILLLQTRPRS